MSYSDVLVEHERLWNHPSGVHGALECNRKLIEQMGGLVY
jgi:hypothetical protein